MKKINIILKYLGVFCLIVFLMPSCEDYLDKAPEAEITEEDVFKKFITFQGYMEDIYQNVVDETLGKSYREHNFNWGDELYHNWRGALVEQFQLGNYWAIWPGFVGYQSNYSPFPGNYNAGTNNRGQGYWDNSWRGIRQSCLALTHLNDMANATQEQKDLIAGQAYFFRGFFHFEVMKHFGGMPYVDTVFSPADELRYPRLTYRETAAKAAADLQKAAQLLPYDWDETTAGKATLGDNRGRITKGAAYGYLGKNLLYSASPLMEGVTTGSYTHNEELCKEAAKAFFEVIKMVPKYYDLWSWDEYYKNFYTLSGDLTMIGKECVFNNPVYMSKSGLEADWKIRSIQSGASGDYAGITQNFVENFGMSDGLPITESPLYNAADPWANRDPRFYYNVICDGDSLVRFTSTVYTIAQFYVGGNLRGTVMTGFGQSKYHHITCNKWDGAITNKFYWECPQMRLADVYLMYAEAVNAAYGPTTVPSEISGGLTAVQAVNIVRARAGVPQVDNRFLTSKENFFENVIIPERAVELALESHRWYDLRRWHIANQMKYRERYILNFPQDHSYFTKVLRDVRVFEDKHYWLPLNTKMVTLYPEFYQNPGW